MESITTDYRIAGNFCLVKFSLSGLENVCPEHVINSSVLSRFLWVKFFSALHNENKTQRKFPALDTVLNVQCIGVYNAVLYIDQDLRTMVKIIN